jgi:hypothetical protein
MEPFLEQDVRSIKNELHKMPIHLPSWVWSGALFGAFAASSVDNLDLTVRRAIDPHRKDWF